MDDARGDRAFNAAVEKASELNAFIVTTPDHALAAAAAIDAKRAKGEDLGKMGGVPIGMKDLFCTDGVQTTEKTAPGSGILGIDDVADDRELWIWPGGDSSWEETGGLSYQWTGTGLTGAVTTASFEGSTATIMTDTDGDYVDVTGPGTLTLDGGATLVITGGASDRAVRVRFR